MHWGIRHVLNKLTFILKIKKVHFLTDSSKVCSLVIRHIMLIQVTGMSQSFQVLTSVSALAAWGLFIYFQDSSY